MGRGEGFEVGCVCVCEEGKGVEVGKGAEVGPRRGGP